MSNILTNSLCDVDVLTNSLCDVDVLVPETVKDLILYLKREDESCDIRRQLGEAQIMQNDLIPIVKEYKDDSTLLDAVLRYVQDAFVWFYTLFHNYVTLIFRDD